MTILITLFLGYNTLTILVFFFFSSRRRHTRFDCDWSSDVCSSDLSNETEAGTETLRKRDVARAKQLMIEAGYKGETIVLITTREIATIGALGDVKIGRASCRERV